MSSDKIEKNNKKTHWKLLCLFPNIISHSYISFFSQIYSICCVRQRKRGGRETLFSLHMYIHYLCCVLFSFFLKNISCVVKISHEEKKKKLTKYKKNIQEKNINRTKEYQQSNDTQTTDVDGLKKMCIWKSAGVHRQHSSSVLCLRLGELTKHTGKKTKRKSGGGNSTQHRQSDKH